MKVFARLKPLLLCGIFYFGFNFQGGKNHGMFFGTNC
jgi:hypothetical protein